MPAFNVDAALEARCAQVADDRRPIAIAEAGYAMPSKGTIAVRPVRAHDIPMD